MLNKGLIAAVAMAAIFAPSQHSIQRQEETKKKPVSDKKAKVIKTRKAKRNQNKQRRIKNK